MGQINDLLFNIDISIRLVQFPYESTELLIFDMKRTSPLPPP